MAEAAEVTAPAHGASPADEGTTVPHRSGGPRRGRADAVRTALLALLGLACGLSTLGEGFYDVSAWAPITIGVLGLTLGLVVAGAGPPRVVPALAVGALAVVWLWSWISKSWAESGEQAGTSAGRWALYAATLLALVLLMRRRSDRWVPLAAATAGIAAVALLIVARMAFGDGADLFFGGRLRDPLGYVNGQAGYFLLGFWPCIAVAEAARSRILAGLGAAGALVLAALLMLSQTRGVLPALLVSALVVMLVVPGRAARVWVLLAVGATLTAIAAPLLDVYQQPLEGGAADPEVVERAGGLILAAAVVLFVLWTAARSLAVETGRRTSPRTRRGLDLGSRGLAAAVVVIGLLAVALAVDDPGGRIGDQYDQFVNLQVDNARSDTRFLSGGGYRYDYWRIAWLEFESEPLRGVGAGNYPVRYFTERRTSEDIRQPHSLPMQVLAELGVVGGLALLAFLGAVAAGLWRSSRRARRSSSRRVLAVAAGGAFAAWLAHTSVDWLHLLPGVTGVALCAAAGLLAPWSRAPAGRPLGAGRIAAVVVAVVATVAAADLVGRLALAEHHRIAARDALTSDPVEALDRANRALVFNDDALLAQVVRSAAYARLGDFARSRRALRDASRLEPSNPLPWTLLGDLYVRRGEISAARRSYRQSLRLNPRDPFVRDLARNPASAVPEQP